MKNDIKLSPVQRFLKLIYTARKEFTQIIYYAIFSGLVALSLPLGIQAIINLIQGAEISTSWIVLVVLVSLGTLFTGILRYMQLRLLENLQQRIFLNASFELSYRFPKMKMDGIRNIYPPELANRFFDTLNIQKGLPKVLLDVPSALLEIIFALIILSFYHTLFMVFGLILAVTLIFVFRYTAKKGLETSLIESKHKYQVAHWIQEIARTHLSFKLSGQDELALNKNDELVSKYLQARESHFKILQFQFLKLIGFKTLITAGLLIIGGVLVLNQSINIGQFVAAEIMILLVINSVEKLIMGLETIYDMLTSTEKLGLVIDRVLENQEGENPIDTADFHMELDQVTHNVPNKEIPILEDISMQIKADSRILIKGESGSGKSSLLKVIAGIEQAESGYIHVNGLSLKSLNINEYRADLGVSLAEESLFEGTLRENLTFGVKDIKESRIMEIINLLGLQDFVKKQPKGLNTVVFPEGKQLPSSISKKIMIARAILKKPKLILLEDALDKFNSKESESIMKYLSDPKQPWALLVVSDNDKWQEFSNEVITLKEGKIDQTYYPKKHA